MQVASASQTSSQSFANGDTNDLGPGTVVLPAGFSPLENPFLFPIGLLDSDVRLDVEPEEESAGSLVEPRHEVPAGDLPLDISRWWLIHSKPRQEKRLADELRRFGVPHYLPVTKCKALTRGRPRFTLAPLFPSYLFLRGDSNQRRAALETNRIVATHRIDDEVGLTRQLWDLADLIQKGVPLRIEERLVSGQTVRVKSGLLKDKRGVIMKRVGKTRLYVFVNELLGGVSLEVEQHMLEPY